MKVLPHHDCRSLSLGSSNSREWGPRTLCLLAFGQTSRHLHFQDSASRPTRRPCAALNIFCGTHGRLQPQGTKYVVRQVFWYPWTSGLEPDPCHPHVGHRRLSFFLTYR